MSCLVHEADPSNDRMSTLATGITKEDALAKPLLLLHVSRVIGSVTVLLLACKLFVRSSSEWLRDSDWKSLSASFLVQLFISHESRRFLFTISSVLEVSTKINLPPEKHDTQRQSNGRTAFNCRQRAAILVSFSVFFLVVQGSKLFRQ